MVVPFSQIMNNPIPKFSNSYAKSQVLIIEFLKCKQEHELTIAVDNTVPRLFSVCWHLQFSMGYGTF
jgi:hypothetical protein